MSLIILNPEQPKVNDPRAQYRIAYRAIRHTGALTCLLRYDLQQAGIPETVIANARRSFELSLYRPTRTKRN